MPAKPCLFLILIALLLAGCTSTTFPAPSPTTFLPTSTKPPSAPTAEPPAIQTAPIETATEAVAVPPAGTIPASAPPPTVASSPTLPATSTVPESTPSSALETSPPAATPPGGVGFLPQTGLWTGSAPSIIISFEITSENGEPMLGDLRVLWLGPEDCTLDHYIDRFTPIEGPEFSRFYNRDDAHFTLTGEFQSPTLIQGVFNFHVAGCSERTVNWQARPK